VSTTTRRTVMSPAPQSPAAFAKATPTINYGSASGSSSSSGRRSIRLEEMTGAHHEGSSKAPRFRAPKGGAAGPSYQSVPLETATAPAAARTPTINYGVSSTWHQE
jgi:hypothetical protein